MHDTHKQKMLQRLQKMMGGVGRMLSRREHHAPSTLTSVLSPIVVREGFFFFLVADAVQPAI
jgi:hypothetical protein